MKETYEIKMLGKFFNKTYKNVKGNNFPDNMNNGLVRFMSITLENEKVIIVNLDMWQGYEISNDLFYIKAKQVKTETNGQTDLT